MILLSFISNFIVWCICQASSDVCGALLVADVVEKIECYRSTFQSAHPCDTSGRKNSFYKCNSIGEIESINLSYSGIAGMLLHSVLCAKSQKPLLKWRCVNL